MDGDDGRTMSPSCSRGLRLLQRLGRWTCGLWLVAGSPVAGSDLEWRKARPLPDPVGVAAPFAGVSGGALVVAGGAQFPERPPWEGGTKVWTDTVWVLDRPEGTWIRAGRLPAPRAYGVSLTVRDAVLCVGGSDARGPVAEVRALEWTAGRFRVRRRGPGPFGRLPGDLPIPLANAAGAMDLAGQVYVACGTAEPGERRASARVFAWDSGSRGRRWTEAPALPAEPRILAIAAPADRGFFLFGGCALESVVTADGVPGVTRRYLRDAWRYHPERGWKRLADLPRPCAAAASPAPGVDGRLLLLGGDDGSLARFRPLDRHPGFPHQAWAFDPREDRWTRIDDPPVSRVTLPAVSWLGRWWLPSGEVRPGVRSPEVWSVGTPEP